MNGAPPQPLVSIVIPHYNRADLLAETLQSIEAQVYPNREVIVVDDGSETAQWAAVQSYATQGVLVLQRPGGLKGPSRCRNLGAAAAHGDYLVFVDSDDLLAPWCLTQRVEAARANPEVDLWIFQVLLFREHPGDLATCWNRLEGDDDLARFLRSDPPWHTTSPLWRREAFERVGGFNEMVVYGDDAELHVRAVLSGLHCRKYGICVPDAFIRRGEPPRITNSRDQMIIASRQTRLVEGSRYLKSVERGRAPREIWEGQYFVEAEFLLFQLTDAWNDLFEVLRLWEQEHGPGVFRRLLVRTYFTIGLVSRNRLYLALRVARRLIKPLLPASYFPPAGSFQVQPCSEKVMAQVLSLLGGRTDPVRVQN